MKKEQTLEFIDLYNQGYSCESIGKMYGLSRQTVHERLTRAKIKLRQKPVLPFIIYDGIKFTVSKTTGYYRSTKRDKHVSLHRYKYEKEIGEIPEGYDVHHIDENKQNNDITNLICMKKSEHSRHHSKGYNQYFNSKTIK